MFETIRKNSKLLMGFLFLLIIPSFVLVGVGQNYFSGTREVVARVDGVDITRAEWDNAHRQESDRLRMNNPGLDARLLDSDQARHATLERLVRNLVLERAARQQRLHPSDAELARALLEIPEISTLTRTDGSLDTEAYRALVGSQGLTPEGFEANLRRELAMRRVMGGIVGSAFVTEAQAHQALDALHQQREVQILRLAAADYAERVQPTPEQLQAWHAEHSELFRQPEEVSVEYLVLDLKGVAASMEATEEELQEHYRQNAEQLAGTEERRASHILINAARDAAPEVRQQARERAEQLLAELRQTPDLFADLARTHSQDNSSARAGGDLGHFPRDAMVKPFADAAFAMQPGDISNVVETDFGYHIIQLTDIKAPEIPSLEQMREQLLTDIRQQKAQGRFAELAEAFANSVYEQGDDLQAVAEKFDLTLKRAERVRPGGNGDSADDGILDDPRFLEAIFAEEARSGQRSTDALELGTSRLVAGRVTQYTPARVLSPEEAGDGLRTRYVAQKAAELARADAAARLEQIRAGNEDALGTALPEAITIARMQPQGQPEPVIIAALRAETTSLPAWTVADLGEDGQALIKILQVHTPPREDQPAWAQQKNELTMWLAQMQALAYYEWLKTELKVQMRVPRPPATEATLSAANAP